MSRRELSFISGGDRIAAWLYEPAGGEPGPAVVMAHGLGGVREAGLEPYAERFAAAGMRVLVFDYRHFGASAGEPRQLLDIRRQQDDWRAAIAYARSMEGADPRRIGIWGWSFGGGHVLAIAAEDRELGAAIALTPMADGVAVLREFGAGGLARRIGLGLRDEIARLRGKSPVYGPLTGPPGSSAALVANDAETGYARLVPPETNWQNRYTARLNLRTAGYRPVCRADRIASPLLVCVCDGDEVTPPGPAAKAAARAPRGAALHYDGGHFDIHFGDVYERSVADQTAFLERHLRVGSGR